MATQLATPTFVAGAKDDLAAADVYKQKGTAPINSFQDAQPLNLPSLEALRGGLSLKSGLKDVVGAAKSTKSYLDTGTSLLNAGNALLKGVAALQTGSVLSRLNAAGSLLSGPLSKLPDSLSVDILGKVTATGGIVATINGVSQQIKAVNLKDINSISNLLGNVTGNPAILTIADKAASVSALGGIVSAAASRGIPNSFGALMGGVNDIGTINQVAGNCLSSVVDHSDLGSLMDMSRLTSAGALKLINPDLISNFSSKFTTPMACTAEQTKANFDSVTGAFNAIDDKWNSTPRLSELGIVDPALNITQIQGGSGDFQKTLRAGAMASTNLDEKLYLLATVYQPTDVNVELKKQFPATTVGSSIPYSNAIDPSKPSDVNPTRSVPADIVVAETLANGDVRKKVLATAPDGSMTLVTTTTSASGTTRIRTVTTAPNGESSVTTYGGTAITAAGSDINPKTGEVFTTDEFLESVTTHPDPSIGQEHIEGSYW